MTAASEATKPDQSPAMEFLTGRLGYWQQRLDLQEWRISVLLTRSIRFKPGTLGDIEWDRDSKTAVIRVLDPADYRLSKEDMLKDMEFTVVHGLVHLELSSLPRNKRSREREDLAVSQIADALLGLNRSANSLTGN